MVTSVANMPLSDRLRAQYVKRWSTVHLTHQQSLAEHSFNVAMIAMELSAVIFGTYDDDLLGKVLYHSLLHDLDEIVTGDIPPDTKDRLRRITPDVDLVLNTAPVVYGTHPDLNYSSALITDIIKVADLIEGAFHVKQHSSGIHAEQVAICCLYRLSDKLDSITNPTLKGAARGLWDRLLTDQRQW